MYECELQMDDRCQLRQMGDFIFAMEEIGLNTDYEGQITYDTSGDIHLYNLSKEQMLSLLMHLQGQLHKDVVLQWVSCYGLNECKEWYGTLGSYPSLDHILFGDAIPYDTADMTEDKVWKRFKDALRTVN